MSRGEIVKIHRRLRHEFKPYGYFVRSRTLIVMHQDGDKHNLREIALCHVRLHYHPINVTLIRRAQKMRTRARDDIINNCNVDA